LIVGLTVVAFGASSPQIAVMAQVAFGGQLVLIIGNVVQGYGRIAYHSPCQSTCSATSISRVFNVNYISHKGVKSIFLWLSMTPRLTRCVFPFGVEAAIANAVFHATGSANALSRSHSTSCCEKVGRQGPSEHSGLMG
jgi:hypothetical protein